MTQCKETKLLRFAFLPKLDNLYSPLVRGSKTFLCQLAAKGEQNCCDFDLEIARSTMSHHFKILRESGVILSRKSGTQHLNSLRYQELDELFPGLLTAVLQSPDNVNR